MSVHNILQYNHFVIPDTLSGRLEYEQGTQPMIVSVSSRLAADTQRRWRREFSFAGGIMLYSLRCQEIEIKENQILHTFDLRPAQPTLYYHQFHDVMVQESDQTLKIVLT